MASLSGLQGGAFGRIINPASNISPHNTVWGKMQDSAGLFYKKPVTLAPVLPMPDPEVIKKAKNASLTSQYGGQGRASTVLSNNSDTLG